MTDRLNVVVLTSSGMGVEVAARVAELPEVRAVTLVTTSVSPVRRGLAEKAAVILRHDGPAGIARAAADRLLRRGAASLAERARRRCPGVLHLHLPDLHAAESRDRLAALGADLGVTAAVYKLGPEVFTIPRLGCLNLHLGRAPRFRGSSPGFYEMLEGVAEVGVTVHRISERLDAGDILLQETFPLDLAPPGDPIAYLRAYQLEVLVPNGARLMAEAVGAVARGEAEGRAQDLSGTRARRRATWEQKRELRRVVRRRRGSVDNRAERALT